MRLSRQALPGLSALLCAIFHFNVARADMLTYENARFGTRLSFPAELFDTRMEPPANGDGMTWTAPDGGSIAIYATNNTLMLDEAGLLADIKSHQAGITYDAKGKGWVVVSGIDLDMVFYQRWEFGSNDVMHSALLRYPVTSSDRYSRLVKPIMDSLEGP